MRYTNEDFIRLIGAVEADGGEHLDQTCMADEIEYRKPDGTEFIEMSTGCEKETVFSISYDPSETVVVREPILEIDPDREEWVDGNGDSRVTRRSKKETLPNGEKRVIWELVERPGEEPLGNADVALLSSVTVCAIDDNVGMWPRFRNAMRDERTG